MPSCNKIAFSDTLHFDGFNLLPDKEQQTINELRSLIKKELNIVLYNEEGMWNAPFVVIGKENHVTDLSLTNSDIPDLPMSLRNLLHLRCLSLSETHLTTVPDFIGELKSLEVLHLSKNPISHLPKALGNLIHLKHLTLNDTKIQQFPDFVKQLKNLEHLDIFNTYAKSLPNFLFEMENLEELYIPKNIPNVDENLFKKTRYIRISAKRDKWQSGRTSSRWNLGL